MSISRIDPMDEDRLPAYYIGSVGRALTLLTIVNERRTITVSDAAQVLDVAPSTAHRLLQVLVHHGYVAQDDRRAYVPGPVSRTTETTAANRMTMPGEMRILNDVAQEVKGTIHVMRLEGNSVRFVSGVDSPEDNGMATIRVGWLLPAHVTAGGRVILSGLPQKQLQELYPDGLPVTRFCRVRTLDELEVQLDRIRRNGYAASRAAHDEICGLGVPIPSETGAPTLALSAGWPPDRFPGSDVPNTVHQLRIAARRFAEAGA